MPDDEAGEFGMGAMDAAPLFVMFLAMVGAGFSENQALKVIAMCIVSAGFTDGMPQEEDHQ